jgi:hypothetical protein
LRSASLRFLAGRAAWATSRSSSRRSSSVSSGTVALKMVPIAMMA